MINKDNTISSIRVLSMIFIVAYHCVCYYGIWDEYFPKVPQYQNIESWRFVCILALQMFTFISGYLYAQGKPKPISELLRQKAMRLLVPYAFWAVVLAVLFPVICNWQGFFIGMMHLWFLLMLFGCFLVVSLTKYKEWELPYMILAIFIGTFIDWVNFKTGLLKSNILAVSQVVNYLPYFLSGIVVCRIGLLERLKENNVALTIGILLLSSIVLLIYHVRGGYPLSPVYIWAFVAALFCSVYSIISKVMDNTNNAPPSLLSTLLWLDKNSMSIHLLHHIFIWLFLFYVPGCQSLMNNYPYIAPIVLFVVVLTLSSLLSWTLHKLNCTRMLLGEK